LSWVGRLADRLLHQERTSWLRSSELEARQIVVNERESRSDALPLILEIVLSVIAVALVVAFW